MRTLVLQSFIIFISLFFFNNNIQGQVIAEMVKDILPGDFGYGVTEQAHFPDSPFSNIIFLSADDGENGRELWRTDGTEEGTYLVKNLDENGSSYPENFMLFNGMVYFTTRVGVWKTDGTEENTTRIFEAYARDVLSINNELYFTNSDGIWKSDGTATGTEFFLEIPSSSSLTIMDEKIYYLDYDENDNRVLMKTDGTISGTEIVDIIFEATNVFLSHSYFMKTFGDRIYFICDHPDYGQELWTSNGIASGTNLVKDFRQGTENTFDGSLASMWHSNIEVKFYGYNGLLYFAVDDGIIGEELWSTDGTEENTVLVQDFNSGFYNSFPKSMIAYNGKLIVFTIGPRGRMYSIDNSTTPSTITEIEFPDHQDGTIKHPIEYQGKLIFSSIDHGYTHIWAYDGNTLEQQHHVDMGSILDHGGELTKPLIMDDQIFLGIDSEEAGYELWKIKITEPLGITFDYTGILCEEGETGSIDIEVVDGTPPFDYQWSDSSLSGANLTDLPIGTYSVTVTDANERFFEQEFEIDLNFMGAPILTVEDITCGGLDNGMVGLEVIFGSSLDFSFDWGANVDTTQLAAGDYIVTITNGYGCTSTEAFTIAEPPVLEVDLESTPSTSNDGSITVWVEGGISPYDFVWAHSSTFSQYIWGLSPGNYSVTVTDATGCSVTQDAVVEGITSTADLTEDSKIKIFPNPFSDAFSIQNNNDQSRRILLKNSIGERIKEIYLDAEKNTRISLFDIPAGLYLVQVLNEEGQLLDIKKIIKQ